MATTTRPITVEEFRRLPPTESFYCELRNGQLVPVTRPKLKHQVLQRRLRRLLEAAAPAEAYVEIEVAFRALPEHELRVADVAHVSPERWREADLEDNIRGAPDLVVEILSPSNTAAELNEKEKLCLDNGAREFWVVDSDLRQVKVSTPDGLTTTYGAGQEIPLRVLGSPGSLSADDIFG